MEWEDDPRVTEEESDKNWEMFKECISSGYVFQIVTSYLDLSSFIAFHDAFPLLWPYWRDRLNCATWLKSQYKVIDLISVLDGLPMIGSVADAQFDYGPHLPSYPLYCVSLSKKAGPIWFDSYLKFLHCNLHSRVQVHPGTNQVYLRCDAGTQLDICDRGRTRQVTRCSFLPTCAPSFFADSMVLLCEENEVQIYSLRDMNCDLSAFVVVPFQPTNMVTSPRGQTILAFNEIHAILVCLEDVATVSYVTDISLMGFGTESAVFYSEREFLSLSVNNSVLKHTVVCSEDGPQLRSETFFDSRLFGAERAPLCDSEGNHPEYLFWYKPKTDTTNDFIMFSEKTEGGRVGNIFRIVFDPRGRPRTRFVTFPYCHVCCVAFKTDLSTAYVVVLTDHNRKAFIDPWHYPWISKEQMAEDWPYLDPSREVYLGVYELTFGEEVLVSVTPRFYIARRRVGLNFPENSLNTNLNLLAKETNRVSAACTRYHLTVNVARGMIYHFSLVASLKSQVYCDQANASVHWGVSRDGRYSCYFEDDMSREHPTDGLWYSCDHFSRQRSMAPNPPLRALQISVLHLPRH